MVWAEREPDEDRVDLAVSQALAEAMQRPRRQPESGGLLLPGVSESSSVEELRGPGQPAGVRVQALPAFLEGRQPAVAPRPHDGETLPADLRETAAVRAAVEALREAVGRSDAAGRQDAAAAAWHAEPIVRLLCSFFEAGIAGVQVNDDNLIVITTALPGDDPAKARIAIGPEGNCACRITVSDTDLGCAAPDVRSFKQILQHRLAEVGVARQDGSALD